MMEPLVPRTLLLSEHYGDMLRTEVVAKSQEPGQHLVMLRWDLESCRLFYRKAVLYGSGGGSFLPPIFNGIHPDQLQDMPIEKLQLGITAYLAQAHHLDAGAPSVILDERHKPHALVCSLRQFGTVCMRLKTMESEDGWFKDVLEHGEVLWKPGNCVHPAPKRRNM